MENEVYGLNIIKLILLNRVKCITIKCIFEANQK